MQRFMGYILAAGISLLCFGNPQTALEKQSEAAGQEDTEISMEMRQGMGGRIYIHRIESGEICIPM